MMIEADVVYGTLNSTGSVLPVMGHPPQNVSDTSLEEYLKYFQNFTSTNSSKKGLKLDFKSIEAFSHSLPYLKNTSRVDYLYKICYFFFKLIFQVFPLWINADILPGPGNSSSVPVNDTEFLRLAAELNGTVLSIGWTTNGTEEPYTDDHIKQMTNITKSYSITNEITFPVRAGNAAKSLMQMESLLKDIPNSTLTIWSSSENDKVDVNLLRNLIFKVGLNRAYVDVPESLSSQLHLETENNAFNAANRLTMVNSFLSLLMILLTIILWTFQTVEHIAYADY